MSNRPNLNAMDRATLERYTHALEYRLDNHTSVTQDQRKQSCYFDERMIERLHEEAARLDRTLSWVVQRCVRLALAEIRRLPALDASDV